MAATIREQHVYEPPSGVLPPLRPYLNRLWERRHLVWHLSRTGTKAAHYDTVLGRLWLVLDPIFTAFTFYLIRIVLIPNNKADAGAWIAHLILAISFFTYFRRVYEGSARSIVANQQLVLNSSAPAGTYPAVVLARAVHDFIPTMLVYALVHLVLGQPITLQLLYLPLIFVLLTMFGLGLGLAFVPWVVAVRDVGELLPYMARIWMYLSPIMFFVSEVPDGIAKYMVLNPLFPYFDALEHIFWGSTPSMGSLLGSLAWSVVAMVIGTALFMRKEREFAIRL